MQGRCDINKFCEDVIKRSNFLLNVEGLDKLKINSLDVAFGCYDEELSELVKYYDVENR